MEWFVYIESNCAVFVCYTFHIGFYYYTGEEQTEIDIAMILVSNAINFFIAKYFAHYFKILFFFSIQF